MASAKSLDEERLLGTSPRLSPDLLPVHSAAHKVSSTSSRRRWIRIVLFAAMLALITYCALLTNVVPAFAAPWSSPGKNKDALNPYPDGRRLTTTSSGKFKIVLFSDLHYGERDTNNTWAAWADEAVSVFSFNPVLLCLQIQTLSPFLRALFRGALPINS